MKKIIFFVVILLNIICLSSCQEDDEIRFLERPLNTNMEYWITQDMTGRDLIGHWMIEDQQNFKKFYSIEYIPYELNGEIIYPHRYVIYEVSPYPTKDSDDHHITKVYITDLTVDVYGINLTNSFKEFDKALKDAGFDIVKKNRERHIAKMDNITVYFCKDYIEITAEAK